MKLVRLSLVLAAACLAHGTAHAQAVEPNPAPATAREVWDLSRLYPTDAAWDAERTAVTAELPKISALKGTLGRDAAAMRAALDQISALRQRLIRLNVYASTQTSTDQRDRRNQERSGLMGALLGQYSAATAWVDPEIQLLGNAKVAAFQAAEPGLARHATTLRDALRRAPHTLAPDVEAALATMGPVLNGYTGARSLLVDADITWPGITVNGKTVVVNDTAYTELRQHPDRAVRQQAFDAIWKTYGQYQNTLGALLAQRVQQGVLNARLRNYPSAVAASLAASEVPEDILRTLVAQTNAGLPTLHRYFKLRQRLLKLPDLHYYDIYPNLVTSSATYPPEAAAAITLDAMQPLGDEYQAQLKLALAGRNTHFRPAPGKSSGAYQTSVWGQAPFVFLNHTDNYESLTTFAHEWGHGMHSQLAMRAQPAESYGYPLFLAEIASTTNEVLLSEHMLKTARTKDERVFVLSQILERVRAGFFRQTMFAEFELMAHDARQRGEALSGKRFTEMYCGLLRKYHGADAGVMTIDPTYCSEWAYIPHFHRPFYVYVYATSTAAAQFFGERIARGAPGAREAYLDVLRAGGSVPPHELLKKAGLDLTSPAPYQQLLARMNAILDEMDRLVP